MNSRGERQLLVDHLCNVAELAEGFARPFGGCDFAFVAGLWHDAGKADPAWQRYLCESEDGTRERGSGPDHKCVGPLLAEGVGVDVVGLLIHAHHGGLRDRREFSGWFQEKRALSGPGKALDALRSKMPDLACQRSPGFPSHVEGDALAAEFFLRMVYSALVDADSLDTEAHMLGTAPSERASRLTLAELWGRYESFLGERGHGAGQRCQPCAA